MGWWCGRRGRGVGVAGGWEVGEKDVEEVDLAKRKLLQV